MKRRYKVLIVCGAFLVLLLCSVVGVSAESVDSSTYKVNVYSYEKYSGSYGQVNIKNGESVSGSGFKTFLNGLRESCEFRHRLTFVDSTGSPIFKAGRKYNFTADNFYYAYTFNQENGNKGSWDTPETLRIIEVRVNYTDGSVGNITNSSVISVNKVNQTYSVSASFVPQKDVSNIIFYVGNDGNPIFDFDLNGSDLNNLITSESFFGNRPESDHSLKLDISVQSEEAGLLVDINNSVQEGTDQITNGWTPNPEKPAGSDSVGELGSIEEQLQSGSEDGINAGMSMITGLGSSLAGFQKGFIFLIDLFDELTGGIPWISSVLTIGLALGIVAFLLNIVGSVASKISRDERRAEADKRRAEADARREKRQYTR